MNKINSVQLTQELEYRFPYHYVSVMPRDGFKEHYVDTWGINYISTIEFILQKISQHLRVYIVDVGCGDGRLTREIKLGFPECHVFGIDYSCRAIKLAQAMNQDIPDLNFLAIDITKERLERKYDMAILMEVFEHVPINECEIFLESLSSILNDNGQLLLTVPHSNKPLEYKHFQHFSVSSICKFLSKHFNVIEIVPFERRGLRRKLISKLLSNRLFTLNSRMMLNLIYKFQKKYIFMCDNEAHCQRIFVRAQKK